MKSRIIVLLTVLGMLAMPGIAGAHVGSPDIFFEGMIGKYPAKVIIRMPGVVPGRATIHVELKDGAPARVAFLPLFFDAAVSNAPPAELATLISGTTNWYTGDLWLMDHGGYTIEVKVNGTKGDASLQIPVNSIATQQLKMPKYLGALLMLLGAGLLLGGIAIVMTAAREAIVLPGQLPDAKQNRKGWIAGAVATGIFATLLFFGNRWWHSEENDFRRTLHTGGWPTLESSIRSKPGERWLDLAVAKKKSKQSDDDEDDMLSFSPDHGKLAHLFLVREPDRGVFAHLHPIRTGGRSFSAALPPLPEGNYSLFCDFTLEKAGISCTATDTVTLLPFVQAEQSTHIDADDSWANALPQKTASSATTNSAFQFADGTKVVWRTHGSLRVNQDAGLQFEVWDAQGRPAQLEPYMEMLSHGVVMRSDGKVFVHLHPMGNYSMASQDFFQVKLARETGDASAALCGVPLVTNQATPHLNDMATVISLPYEFPSGGNYRIWVQFKISGKVFTAVFDASVADQNAA